MLTHGNMASNLNCSLAEFPVQPGDVSISFLPLSHVTARHVDFALLYRGVTLAHLAAGDPASAGPAGSEAHIFCCGAAGVRKNTLSDGAEGAGLSELDFLSLGPVGGEGTPGRSSGGPEADVAMHGSWRTGWCIRKCEPGWAGALRFSFPAERPWDANSRNGMPTSGSAFMRVMG